MSSSTPMISVILPTKDRVDTLIRTLDSLFTQITSDAFEVVVADNGSNDGTVEVLRRLKTPTHVNLVIVEQPQPGPAAARNSAVSKSSGNILLLLGDDTEPSGPELVQGHADLHRSRPEDEFAVLGHISWSPRATVTDFMRWLDSGGTQFHYHALHPGNVDPSRFFYSSHLSMTRAIFDAAEGFDERFPYAAIEDTEFGQRLDELGLALEYHPELEVWHDHPTTLPQSLARMRRVGEAAALYHTFGSQRSNEVIRKPEGVKWNALRAAAPALRTLPVSKRPRKLYSAHLWALHFLSYEQGYRQAERSR